MICRPFDDLSRAWLCYVGPLVTLAMLDYVVLAFGDLSRAGLCYVVPLVTLAVVDNVM